MPIYMDIHEAQGLTPEDVAIAHQLDLQNQEEFGCRCITYWMDPIRGSAFCLIEAPSKEAVLGMHEKAHKQLPAEITEVDKRVVKAFLGRIKDPVQISYRLDDKVPVFDEPAFRYLCFIKITNYALMQKTHGEKEAGKLKAQLENLCARLSIEHGGNLADLSPKAIVLSFDTLTNACDCIIALNKKLQPSRDKISMRICLCGGNPIDKDDEMFGTVLNLGRELVKFSNPGEIILSAEVAENLSVDDQRRLSNAFESVPLNKNKQTFFTNLMRSIATNFRESDFDIEKICEDLSLSASQLYRKCKDLTSLSPNVLIREYRLEQALNQILDSGDNISRIAFDTGFNNPSYFTKCFLQKYGVRPKDLVVRTSFYTD